MKKIEIFTYAVRNNPLEVYKALQEVGYSEQLNLKDERDRKMLYDALRGFVKRHPEKGYALLAKIHPDRELILNYKDNNACGCNAADGDIVAGDSTNDQPKEDKTNEKLPEFTEPKSDTNMFGLKQKQTVNILIGVGLTLAFIGLFKGAVK